MFEADELCHNVSIINQGKIIVTGSPSELKAKLLEKKSIRVITRDLSLREIYNENLLNSVEWTVKEIDDGQYVVLQVIAENESTLPELLDMIARHRGKVVNVTVSEPSLEDVFLKFTGKGLIG
jgi:ABC-2 type transport system ATP-binding protein